MKTISLGSQNISDHEDVRFLSVESFLSVLNTENFPVGYYLKKN